MMPFFVQLPPVSGAEIVVWLLCAAAVMVILNQGHTTYRNFFKEKPDPKEAYQPKGQYVTRAEFDEHRRDVKDLSSSIVQLERQLHKDKGEILQSGEDRAQRLHERVDEVEKEIAHIPNQIIALLRNTGVIR
jgi:outer membrane murein-binding lipoprotein Lpp